MNLRELLNERPTLLARAYLLCGCIDAVLLLDKWGFHPAVRRLAYRLLVAAARVAASGTSPGAGAVVERRGRPTRLDELRRRFRRGEWQ